MASKLVGIWNYEINIELSNLKFIIVPGGYVGSNMFNK